MVDQPKTNTMAGVTVSLQELIDLRQYALYRSQPLTHKNFQLSGNQLTPSRGRGLEFDATREYQAGDDIRHMAWRVTARSLKPHIKMYREEKERPVWFGIDLSPSLYFGTRRQFKSVASIKKAALLGWAHLTKRERVGALIATAAKLVQHPPQLGEKSLLAMLNTLTECSHLRPAFDGSNYLMHLLQGLQAPTHAGDLVCIFSDFNQLDADIERLLLLLLQKCQVELYFVYDPLEATPPPPHLYQLTDGKQSVVFDTQNSECRQTYLQQFNHKHQQLLNFCRHHNIALHTLCTEQEVK